MEEAQNTDQVNNPQPPQSTEATRPKRPLVATCTLLEFLEFALDHEEAWKQLQQLFKETRDRYNSDKNNNRPVITFKNLPMFRPRPVDPRTLPPVKLSQTLEEREETPRQRANRINAQKSTGPRTEEGKARSSQNSIKHGLTAEIHLQTCFEDDGDFTIFQKELHDHFKPADFYQRQLVGRIVTCMWRLRRAPIVEAQLLNYKTINGHQPESAWLGNNADRQLLNLSRYETNIDRDLNRCIRLLNEAKAATPSPCAETLSSTSGRTEILSVKAEGERAGDGGQGEKNKTNPTACISSNRKATAEQLQSHGNASDTSRQSPVASRVPPEPCEDKTNPTKTPEPGALTPEPCQDNRIPRDPTNATDLPSPTIHGPRATLHKKNQTNPIPGDPTDPTDPTDHQSHTDAGPPSKKASS